MASNSRSSCALQVFFSLGRRVAEMASDSSALIHILPPVHNKAPGVCRREAYAQIVTIQLYHTNGRQSGSQTKSPATSPHVTKIFENNSDRSRDGCTHMWDHTGTLTHGLTCASFRFTLHMQIGTRFCWRKKCNRLERLEITAKNLRFHAEKFAPISQTSNGTPNTRCRLWIYEEQCCLTASIV